MSYGFRAINANGKTTIDQRYKNYRLISSGTFNVNLSVLTDQPTGAAFPLKGGASITSGLSQTSLVFLRWSEERLRLYPGSRTPTAHRFGFSFDQTGGLTSASVPVDFRIVDVGVPSGPAIGTYGLRVTGNDGQLVYDSRYNHPRIKSIFKFKSDSFSGGVINPTSPLSSTDWICASPLYPFFEQNIFYGSPFFANFLHVGGSYIKKNSSGILTFGYENRAVLRLGQGAFALETWYWHAFPGFQLWASASRVAPPANHLDTVFVMPD